MIASALALGIAFHLPLPNPHGKHQTHPNSNPKRAPLASSSLTPHPCPAKTQSPNLPAITPLSKMTPVSCPWRKPAPAAPSIMGPTPDLSLAGAGMQRRRWPLPSRSVSDRSDERQGRARCLRLFFLLFFLCDGERNAYPLSPIELPFVSPLMKTSRIWAET